MRPCDCGDVTLHRSVWHITLDGETYSKHHRHTNTLRTWIKDIQWHFMSLFRWICFSNIQSSWFQAIKVDIIKTNTLVSGIPSELRLPSYLRILLFRKASIEPKNFPFLLFTIAEAQGMCKHPGKRNPISIYIPTNISHSLIPCQTATYLHKKIQPEFSWYSLIPNTNTTPCTSPNNCFI